MRIKKANVKRLASLSALGAAVLSANSASGQNSNIVYSGILNETAGMGSASVKFSGPMGVGGVFYYRSVGHESLSFNSYVNLREKRGASRTHFEFLGSG